MEITVAYSLDKMKLEEFEEVDLKIGDSIVINYESDQRSETYFGVYTELRKDGSMFREPFIFVKRNNVPKDLGDIGVPLCDVVSITKQ